ncbi:hypothetical protein VCRLGP8_1430628 [Vibrio crassostreae]|nr:hypothetical protein VCRA2117O378_20207 [Vibrio crassostreae]CAK2337765.1 hypothetical protein VCRA2119O386_20207 [Vibrio crassostreae]CAK2909752.1 hypothetical protein VCRA2120O390_20207 [Vibrio crassostreae]CAK3434375.1 hypothetical protein VCRA2120O388_20207 [Vibrio crassostreae]CAK3447330.1 hypothetical protein VCRA2121O334_30061 [Vibrio crassostreae]
MLNRQRAICLMKVKLVVLNEKSPLQGKRDSIWASYILKRRTD